MKFKSIIYFKPGIYLNKIFLKVTIHCYFSHGIKDV